MGEGLVGPVVNRRVHVGTSYYPYAREPALGGHFRPTDLQSRGQAPPPASPRLHPRSREASPLPDRHGGSDLRPRTATDPTRIRHAGQATRPLSRVSAVQGPCVMVDVEGLEVCHRLFVLPRTGSRCLTTEPSAPRSLSRSASSSRNSRRSQPSWAWRTGSRPGGVEAFNALESSAMRAAKSWRSEIVSAWRSSALGSSGFSRRS